MWIVKNALPSGQSYALKPSILEDALKSAAVQTETRLYQWRPGWLESKVLFRAHFYPAGRYYKNQDELLTVTSHAVPASVRAGAKTFIEGRIIPEFIEWITELEALPTGSTVRREKQSFERKWTALSDDEA